MSLGTSVNGGFFRIQLDGTIDIACAAELKASLVDALAAGREICISLEGVEELDVTAVQLLWSAAREAKQRGTGFSIAGTPEPVRRSLAEAALELPVAIPCMTSGCRENSLSDRATAA